MVNRISDSLYMTSKKEEKVKPQVSSINNQIETKIHENSTEDILPADKAKQMTESLNTLLETTNTKLRYEFHDELEKYYVTIVDTKTDKVIQEIPNKKLMDMYSAMLDFLGLFIDKKI
ncbi:flagellar protein FlaG [Ureibacillus sp. GCM10028918]|uniref:flagellar protein FlaG n=1 Tax=Ureibacillus sp. GCM10028918 TaxID=3273429 RepID=UPI0036200CE0